MKTAVRWSIASALAALMAAPAMAVSPLLKEFEEAFIALGEMVGPSVVEISAEGMRAEEDDTMNELFRFFAPEEEEEEETPEENETPDAPTPPRPNPVATGSGFIFDRLGHIITNNHVVDNATKVTVQLQNGAKREAEVVGTDSSTDVAVIKIDPTGLDLRAAALGDSDVLRVGQFAIAMGSPRGLTQSISFGHVSGLGRERLELPDTDLRFQHFIQTDAAINLGNSGGPLLNIDGEVIGVNIAIVFGANSIGFAIPINRVKAIVPELIASGKVTRGWLGVSIMDIADAASENNQTVQALIDAFGLKDDLGALVRDVTWGGPAEKAKLRKDDVIWKIDGKSVQNTLDLINQISDIEPGTNVELMVWRSGELVPVTAEVAEFPSMDVARYGREFLGIHLLKLEPDVAQRLDLPEGTQGVIVPAVTEGSPAEEAGIRPFDIVVKVGQKPVTNRESFMDVLAEVAEPGKTLLVHVIRPPQPEEQKKFIKVPADFSID